MLPLLGADHLGINGNQRVFRTSSGQLSPSSRSMDPLTAVRIPVLSLEVCLVREGNEGPKSQTLVQEPNWQYPSKWVSARWLKQVSRGPGTHSPLGRSLSGVITGLVIVFVKHLFLFRLLFSRHSIESYITKWLSVRKCWPEFWRLSWRWP